MRWALLLAVACCSAAAGDLGTVRAEPNLEKRSGKALDNAAAALKSARDAYDKGDSAAVAAAAAEISDSVELAWTSLQQTGKNPRRSPKWFKRAEIATRDLARRVENFQLEMSYTDRAVLDPVKAKIHQVHDDLLVGLMEGKRK